MLVEGLQWRVVSARKPPQLPHGCNDSKDSVLLALKGRSVLVSGCNCGWRGK